MILAVYQHALLVIYCDILKLMVGFKYEFKYKIHYTSLFLLFSNPSLFLLYRIMCTLTEHRLNFTPLCRSLSRCTKFPPLFIVIPKDIHVGCKIFHLFCSKS